MHPLNQKANSPSGRRYRVELITAESEASLFVRHRRLIRFPQLTMPLLAAWTPDHWQVSHTDEIVQRVEATSMPGEVPTYYPPGETMSHPESTNLPTAFPIGL